MASHLLNILPFMSISNNTPHYHLFHNNPTYDHLRVFGCLCFPRHYTSHKLHPRSSPCIFLGYLVFVAMMSPLGRSLSFGTSPLTRPSSYMVWLPPPNHPLTTSFLKRVPPLSAIQFFNLPTKHHHASTDLDTPIQDEAYSPSPIHSHPKSLPHLPPSSSPRAHPMTDRFKHGIVNLAQCLNLHTSSVSYVSGSHL